MKEERRKLVRELHIEGIKWQAEAERRWLADSLVNKKAIGLRFLKTTKVRRGEGARERDLEWERRNNQVAGINLGGDNLTVAVSHSCEIKHKWKMKGHKG